MKSIPQILYTILLMASFGAEAAVINSTVPPNPEPASAPPFTLSIAIPEHGGQKSIENRGRDPHFHVLVTNRSDQSQRLWREWCSWGYSMLSFQVTDPSGKVSTVVKKPKAWSKNYPDFWTIRPHESLVLDVYFSEGGDWEGFPLPQGIAETVSISAILDVKPDASSRKYSVWTGRIASGPENFTIRK